MRWINSLVRDTSGASAVEFAVLMPVFITFICGILAYGMYFGAANSVEQLAADAARASVAGLTDPERSEIARNHVAANATSYPLIVSKRLTVDARPLGSDASQFAVSIAYDSGELPIWVFTGLIPLPSKMIVRTSTIKRGGY